MTMQTDLHRFRAFSQSLDIIRALTPLCVKLRRHDASLTKQLRTAASSISLRGFFKINEPISKSMITVDWSDKLLLSRLDESFRHCGTRVSGESNHLSESQP